MMGTNESITGPVNLGNPGEFTIIELAKKIKDMTGSKSNITYCTLPKDDPKQRKPDITLAQDTFGWSPQVRLDEGLKHTIDYFSALLSR